MVLFFICCFVGLFNKNALSTNFDFYLILDGHFFLVKISIQEIGELSLLVEFDLDCMEMGSSVSHCVDCTHNRRGTIYSY
jgi:hypothetical protein